MGFRNPWRWSVDRTSGRLYVGDVGQSAWEEIDEVVAGRDYGWVDMEGFHCNDDGSCDELLGPHEVNADGLSMPLIDFPNSEEGCAVIGGAVYRSCEVAEWDGICLYSDYCNSDIRALRWDGVTVENLGVCTWSVGADRLRARRSGG